MRKNEASHARKRGASAERCGSWLLSAQSNYRIRMLVFLIVSSSLLVQWPVSMASNSEVERQIPLFDREPSSYVLDYLFRDYWNRRPAHFDCIWIKYNCFLNVIKMSIFLDELDPEERIKDDEREVQFFYKMHPSSIQSASNKHQ